MTTPAIDGWFTLDGALIGTRCDACGCYFFPPERTLCRNPACGAASPAEVELSRRGKIWSFAVNHYAAPEPYVGKDPFEPYTVVAVELAEEQMVVLGQLADGIDPASLKIGDEVEVTVEPLFEDKVVWKWRRTS